jgi:hypothetical protein
MKDSTGKFGGGGRSVRGTNKIVICDDKGVLYGWRTVLSNPVGTTLHQLEGVHVDAFLAYLKVHHSDKASVRRALELDIAETEDLRAIDAEVTLYEADLIALQRLMEDYWAGKIPGIDPGEDEETKQ